MANNIHVGDLNDLDKEWMADRTALNRFMKEIESHVTGGCMIPMNLPKSEILNIINRAKQWFYKNYYDSVRKNYYIIPRDYFKTETWKKTRAIRFKKFSYKDPHWDGSSDIISVIGINAINNEYHLTSNKMGLPDNSDFDLERNILRGIESGNGAGGEKLMAYVINLSYYDLFRQIIKHTISFDYNRNSKSLRILGEDVKDDLMVEVEESIEDEYLFDDELFFRYVVAMVKISLGSKMSMFSYTLPGGVEFNADALLSQGQEELEIVKEEITGAMGTDRADWFLVD